MFEMTCKLFCRSPVTLNPLYRAQVRDAVRLRLTTADYVRNGVQLRLTHTSFPSPPVVTVQSHFSLLSLSAYDVAGNISQ